MPNIFAEITIAILHFIALYIVFGKLHRPQGKRKKIATYILMLFWYFIVVASWWIIGNKLSMILGLSLFLLLGLLCRRDGDQVRPIISAFYVAAMFVMIAMIGDAYASVLLGMSVFTDMFGLASYMVEFIQSALYILSSLFYYLVSRKISTNMPFSFSLLIILMPLAAVIIGLFVAGDISQLIGDEGGRQVAAESGLFLYGGLFCTLVLIFNMCAFYLYVRLAVTYESLRFAQNLAQTPPVWTAEHGLSALFIEKYQITPRERQVMEILILGKTDKEIALELDLAVNTVQAHLKHVYRKTEAAGRFALAALVRGE